MAYDRTPLIRRSIATLTHTLVEESIIVALVCILFLFHVRSAFVAILSIPLSILMAFIVMKWQGLGINIMSLGGIAISIGVLVDAAIIMVENAHKHYEEWSGKRSHFEIILRASQEVGPTLFFTLLVITVSFMPVFTLQAQEGRLFRPLAFTKTYALAMSALLSVTVIPVLMYWFVRGKIHSEEKHPVSRVLRKAYTPVLNLALRWRYWVLVGAVLLTASIWIPIRHIGSEFMPPLWEGDLLYMPTTFPGLSITKAREILQQTDKVLRTFPEVESVFGKIGRADTATDPAPLSMVETTLVLKDPSKWRPGMTKDKLIEEMDRAVQFPGVTNAWTMPIKTRIDMLSTGIKTPVGVKIAGPDLQVLEDLGKQVEAVVKGEPGTLSAYSERVMGGNYFDFKIDREAAARYGLTVGDVQDVIHRPSGGWTCRGRWRVSSATPSTCATLASCATTSGGSRRRWSPRPPASRSPSASSRAWTSTRGRRRSSRRTRVPTPGSSWTCAGSTSAPGWRRPGSTWPAASSCPPATASSGRASTSTCSARNSGFWSSSRSRCSSSFSSSTSTPKSLTKTAIVLLAVPFSLVGAIWLMFALGYNWSIAVWVGLIALAGLDAETGVVMLLYLDIAHESWREKGPHGDLCRSGRGRGPRRGPAHPPQDDDGHGHPPLPRPDPVGHGDGGGRDASDRRSDGGRRPHVLPGRADRLPVALFRLALAPPAQDAALPRGLRWRAARGCTLRSADPAERSERGWCRPYGWAGTRS